MSKSEINLGSLFGAALEALTANRQEINGLDGYNGNHGDNMVENLQILTEALRAKSSRPPAEALQYARQKLQSNGRGGSSRYYISGLDQAASELKNRSALEKSDIITLVLSLLGALPSQGYPKRVRSSDSVLEQVMRLSQKGQLGAGSKDKGLDVGDVLNTVLPAALTFLQAKQSGGDASSAEPTPGALR